MRKDSSKGQCFFRRRTHMPAFAWHRQTGASRLREGAVVNATEIPDSYSNRFQNKDKSSPKGMFMESSS